MEGDLVQFLRIKLRGLFASWSGRSYTKGVFGMALEPNSRLELGRASQTPQLQKKLEQPNSIEFLEL